MYIYIYICFLIRSQHIPTSNMFELHVKAHTSNVLAAFCCFLLLSCFVESFLRNSAPMAPCGAASSFKTDRVHSMAKPRVWDRNDSRGSHGFQKIRFRTRGYQNNW